MAKKKSKKSNKNKVKGFLKDYEEAKRDHIEALTDKMLRNDEKNQKLKEKKINKDFLDLF